MACDGRGRDGVYRTTGDMMYGRKLSGVSSPSMQKPRMRSRACGVWEGDGGNRIAYSIYFFSFVVTVRRPALVCGSENDRSYEPIERGVSKGNLKI